MIRWVFFSTSFQKTKTISNDEEHGIRYAQHTRDEHGDRNRRCWNDDTGLIDGWQCR